MSNTWEPNYGFCAFNETDTLALAKSLEAIRRQVCAYGGGDRCDCKYGLSVDENVPVSEFGWGQKSGIVKSSSEHTGCPELREMIHRLLHRDTPLF